MLPNIGMVDDLGITSEDSTSSNTQTFRINLSKNIIAGKISDLDALIQSVYLMLSIEADQYVIYPYTYGLKTLDLIGKPHYYVIAVLPKRVEELLLADERITGVSDFEFEKNRDRLGMKFTIHTIYGDAQVEKEVVY